MHDSYPVPSLGDEDFNIPPITPPTLPEHAMVHMPDGDAAAYHPLCPPLSQNGLHPFHPSNMELPAITVSNILGQDGALLSNSLSMRDVQIDRLRPVVRGRENRDGRTQVRQVRSHSSGFGG
ncbi:hypothetical protein Z043_122745 [Scleropages formosus]|uniref:Uncharacterized protein n=1 Tax=Scleropages formosus TaxID=113540 RepID=A0A0P7TEW6_SCLFO|nr:hypothetical protein Z043_122745 [Scleropages formosus]